MPMEIIVYDGPNQVGSLPLPGDVGEYDIIIKSTEEVRLPETYTEDSPPEIPDVPLEDIEKKNNREFYKRMAENSDTQPAEVRKFVYQHRDMTRKQIDAWAEQEGYSPHGGGIQSALIVLDNITDEIERVGSENEDQRIVWTGSD